VSQPKNGGQPWEKAVPNVPIMWAGQPNTKYPHEKADENLLLTKPQDNSHQPSETTSLLQHRPELRNVCIFMRTLSDFGTKRDCGKMLI